MKKILSIFIGMAMVLFFVIPSKSANTYAMDNNSSKNLKQNKTFVVEDARESKQKSKKDMYIIAGTICLSICVVGGVTRTVFKYRKR